MTAEPRVEELLATIRRAIDRDINELDARDAAGAPVPNLRSTLMQDVAPQAGKPGRDADSNIASLRQRVQRHKLDTAVVPQAPVLRPTHSLYEAAPESVFQSEQEPEPYYPPRPQPWVQDVQPQSYLEQPGYSTEPYQQPDAQHPDQALLSPQSAYAAQASFQALANAMVAQLGGDAGLQDRADELLRPLLRQWLDDNLPTMVERLVRDEIERVARRGR
ncbi:MAG TPA: DUF2497 domain-containing protein [Aestuariivirga sp.]